MNEMRKLIDLFEGNDLTSTDLVKLNLQIIEKRANYKHLDQYHFKRIEYAEFRDLVKLIYPNAIDVESHQSLRPYVTKLYKNREDYNNNYRGIASFRANEGFILIPDLPPG